MQPRALPVVTVLVAGLAVPPSAAGAPDPGPEFRAVGPAGGSVSAFAFGADGRIFSGSRGSGVFSSDNGGNTWVRRGDGLPPDVSVSHVEAWPGSRVVYLSTWADGAYRSTDNGTTWRRITQVATVDDVAFHPSDPDTVFLASSGNGLLRSTDAGESWTTLTEPNGQPVRAEAVEIAPSRPDTVYLVDVTLRRSTDGGDTWTGLGPSYTIVEDVEVDPSDPDTVYASDLSEGVQRTTDGGAHWSRLDLPEYGMDGIAVDPTDPDTVWVGTWADGTVYRSSDGGSSWAQLLVPGARHATPVVRVGPDGRSWVGAENRGPLVSADDGASWRLRRTGFLGSGIPALVAPTQRLVLAGTFGDGIQRSTDGGSTWRSSGISGGRLRTLVAQPGSPQVVVAGADRGTFRSADGGATWDRVATFPATDVVFSPSQPARAYAVFTGGWALTDDGGRTWQRRRFPLGIYGSSEVVVHPTRPGRIWMTCSCGVMWSTDAGRTWQTPQSGTTPPSVNEMVMPADRPGTLYAAGDYGLYRSTGGARDGTWQAIGPPAAGSSDGHAVVTAPGDGDTVYYGAISDSGYPGVYRSTDGGDTWTRWTSGMPTTWVQSLALTPDGGRLFAGTTAYGVESGGGVLLADLP